ncbi:alpha/beta fold hydrolase [Rubrobacter marinus]|uniref:Alpha/beta fold hydrolase n=1 Tax=Rubrobacter marinus TaxID=2653852 RepID=A0A6G8PVF0_9ACTN|nr:alpha/beta hydrolase [Rubrobacter marinus]QIN78153.1 alpha/beta fold hydrolase [Rubrobacter marinus]
MFEGFERHRVAGAEGVEINVVLGGEGPPVLLLHGYPQTHAMWHGVAPLLADAGFSVAAADLRGYGDSSKPGGDEAHVAYSKRAMADDMVRAMASLGFERFAVAGHDRGGRVGHRMALDHAGSVSRLAVLDILPTRHLFSTVDRNLATAYYHWFFLSQPYDFPETLIGGSRSYFLRSVLGRYGSTSETFAPEALAEYERCFDERTVHASCEDYRAAASIDLSHDDSDRENGRRVECPLLALWGRNGAMHGLYSVLEVWRAYAGDVRGRPVDAGHYLAEERPEETARELAAFLSA